MTLAMAKYRYYHTILNLRTCITFYSELKYSHVFFMLHLSRLVLELS